MECFDYIEAYIDEVIYSKKYMFNDNYLCLVRFKFF